MARTTKLQDTYSIRDASKYLDSLGVDVSEMRMRSLVRQHDIFTKDPTGQTKKAKSADSDMEVWRIGREALDTYAQAYLKGDLQRAGGGGTGKLYRISLNGEQLNKIREFCAANGIAEPVRPKYHNQSKKAKAERAAAKAAGNGGSTDDADFDDEDEGDEEDLEGLLEGEE